MYRADVTPDVAHVPLDISVPGVGRASFAQVALLLEAKKPSATAGSSQPTTIAAHISLAWGAAGG
jgi:putative NIF3 family GTP cyclohydrolase 1 type 2